AAFIGLGRLLPAALALLRDAGDIVALVKPQFEVGREALRKGGVVRDARARAQAIDAVKARAHRLGLELRGALDSSLEGPRGNLEHFVWWESTTRAVEREP
ncbi:MAG: 16S/23S rRNA (cytidine-2'-O)-methyltransferase, partial [Proteobacteria bacterium]|nr:16S/23S rRNA (cytidine-2'-O)-methyltransferase [Pseudomonadota bacterium]